MECGAGGRRGRAVGGESSAGAASATALSRGCNTFAYKSVPQASKKESQRLRPPSVTARACDSSNHRYTPGSYWVNPPSPRTVDGMHADPYSCARVAYDMTGSVVDPADTGVRVMRATEVEESDELSAAERAILDDLAM